MLDAVYHLWPFMDIVVFKRILLFLSNSILRNKMGCYHMELDGPRSLHVDLTGFFWMRFVEKTALKRNLSSLYTG